MIYVCLLMALEAASTLKERFGHARQTAVEMFAGRKRPGRTYQGYVKARRRITRRQSSRSSNASCAAAIGGSPDRSGGGTAGWPFAADGTRIELPRTAKNERAFGGAGRDKDRPAVVPDESVPSGDGSALGLADRAGDRSPSRCIYAGWSGNCPGARCWWRMRALPASICCGRCRIAQWRFWCGWVRTARC